MVSPRSDTNSLQGLPCKSKAFYSPETKHGRQVGKVNWLPKSFGCKSDVVTNSTKIMCLSWLVNLNNMKLSCINNGNGIYIPHFLYAYSNAVYN